MFGIDSDYDFDPVWEKCREVKIAPTFHSAGSNQALRNSPTNFTYNHIGHFADAGHAAAKGIFLGGVTRRFPELRFAFLEGGVGWGAQLFGDLMEHWERRNIKALENMKPEKLDRDLLMSYVEKYGYKEHAAALRERDGWPDPELHMTGGIDNLDDFAACKFTRKEDWIDLFVTPYYFGCEADDRMNATAFLKLNPFDAQLNAIYSSDIGHFDVIDMREPLPEAYELVEDGYISQRQFPRLRLHQRGDAVGHAEPRFLQGHAGREGSRCGSQRRPTGRPTPTRRSRPGSNAPSLLPLGGGVLRVYPPSYRLQGRPIPAGAGGQFPAPGKFLLPAPASLGFVNSDKELRDFP